MSISDIRAFQNPLRPWIFDTKVEKQESRNCQLRYLMQRPRSTVKGKRVETHEQKQKGELTPCSWLSPELKGGSPQSNSGEGICGWKANARRALPRLPCDNQVLRCISWDSAFERSKRTVRAECIPTARYREENRGKGKE